MSKHLPLDIRVPIEQDNPSICRDESLCIKCGLCKEVCAKEIGVHGMLWLACLLKITCLKCFCG